MKWLVKSEEDKTLDKKSKKNAIKNEKRIISGWKNVVKNLLVIDKHIKFMIVKLKKASKGKKSLFSNKDLNEILIEILVEAEYILVLSVCSYIHLYTGEELPTDSPVHKLKLDIQQN